MTVLRVNGVQSERSLRLPQELDPVSHMQKVVHRNFGEYVCELAIIIRYKYDKALVAYFEAVNTGSHQARRRPKLRVG